MPAPSALPDPRPTADKDALLVQDMFDRVAPRYDLANTVLSFGQDRHWRRVAVKAVDPRPDDRILDVASGTGMLAHELRSAGAAQAAQVARRAAAASPRARRAVAGSPTVAGRAPEVLALDFSWNMLAAGAQREAAGRNPGASGLLWVNGDGTRLPLRDASVDAVTISFGLRNLPDTAAGLRELARVTRPGGRLVVLEFSRPTWAPFRELYLRYLLMALPKVATVVTSDPAAYRYLAESIVAWPDQKALARKIQDAGWSQVRWKNLSGGIVAAHHATLPGASGSSGP